MAPDLSAGFEPLLPRDAFVGLDGSVAHLAAGGETPPLKAAVQAMVDFMGQKSRGMAGRDEFTAHYSAVKRRLARFLRLPDSAAARIAFVGSAAEGINRFAECERWESGDEVVALADEYPNSLAPWLSRAGQGVKLVAVEPSEDSEAAIEAAITDRTRVISVSHVSYLNGRRLKLDQLRRMADGCDAKLVVDASQSLGVLPVEARLCDVMVSCCYKFILGIHGAGIFYCSEQVLQGLTPSFVGWHSIDWPSVSERSIGYQLKSDAARLELGNPPFANVVALDEGIKALEAVPTTRLEAHIGTLRQQLRGGLAELGATLWGPADESRMSANVVFGSARATDIVDQLAEGGVLAWSGDDRVRLSLHGYNDESDVAKALDLLATLDIKDDGARSR